MGIGGIKTEYLFEMSPAPPGASVASFSRRSAAKGPGFYILKRVPPNPDHPGDWECNGDFAALSPNRGRLRAER